MWSVTISSCLRKRDNGCIALYTENTGHRHLCNFFSPNSCVDMTWHGYKETTYVYIHTSINAIATTSRLLIWCIFTRNNNKCMVSKNQPANMREWIKKTFWPSLFDCLSWARTQTNDKIPRHSTIGELVRHSHTDSPTPGWSKVGSKHIK